MQKICLMALLLIFASQLCAAQISNVDRYKAEAEKKQEADRGQIYSKIALALLDAADQQFNAGEMEKGFASVRESVDYAEKATNLAKQNRKKIKNVEITLRKCSRRLEQIRRSLAIDDQPPLAVALARIEDLRKVLLGEIFS